MKENVEKLKILLELEEELLKNCPYKFHSFSFEVQQLAE